MALQEIRKIRVSGISSSLMHWRTHVQEHMDLNVSASYITLISRVLLIFVGGVQNFNAILAHSGCFCNAHVTGSICVAIRAQHFNLISSDFLNCNTLKRRSIDATSRVFHNFCLHSFIHPPQFWPPGYHAIADPDCPHTAVSTNLILFYKAQRVTSGLVFSMLNQVTRVMSATLGKKQDWDQKILSPVNFT